MLDSENPILNNPYREPKLHYATNADGELDYSDVVPGRRPFSGSMQSIPRRQGPQRHLIGQDDLADEDDLVNRLRKEIKDWREAEYPGALTRITRELLNFWFRNEERGFDQSLFFAQQDAIETAIYLNEV